MYFCVGNLLVSGQASQYVSAVENRALKNVKQLLSLTPSAGSAAHMQESSTSHRSAAENLPNQLKQVPSTETDSVP